MLLVGAGWFAVGLGGGLLAWGVLAPDEQLLTGAAVIALVFGPVSIGVVGFVAGWFGRENDVPVVAAVGYGTSAALVFGVLSFFVTDWQLAVAVPGVVSGVLAAFVGRVTWWVGNAVCELRGLATGPELVAPAYPKEVDADAMWTTRAGPALRSTLDAVAGQIDASAPVQARAVGVLLGFPRDRAAVFVLVAGRLAIQPVDLEGAPTGAPTVVSSSDLAEASIRSQAVDGSTRRQINAFDDVIELRTVDGLRLRLRLPYGTRGAGATTAGPDAIRSWFRTSAVTYR